MLTAIEGGEGLPEQPDWLTLYTDEMDVALAQDAWAIIVKEMQEAGIIVRANGHAIRRLVEFRVQYDRASRQVAEGGTILKARKTRVPQYSPHWIVMRQADDNIVRLEAELGIAPTRRGKAVKVQRVKKASRASDAYLKPVAG